MSGSCKKDFLSQKLTNVKDKGLFGPKNQAGAELKLKEKIDQFSKKQKKNRTFLGKKTSWGWAFEQKRIFGQKNWPIKKNESYYFFWPKKQAGVELKQKKIKFWAKKLTNFQKEKKIENKVQKLTNFTEKKDFSGQKNKLGLSLRRKKGFLGQKLGKNWE